MTRTVPTTCTSYLNHRGAKLHRAENGNQENGDGESLGPHLGGASRLCGLKSRAQGICTVLNNWQRNAHTTSLRAHFRNGINPKCSTSHTGTAKIAIASTAFQVHNR